jgi:DNA-binding HxlR family transcriptional regulator
MQNKTNRKDKAIILLGDKSINKKDSIVGSDDCPAVRAMKIIGGNWKLIILHFLINDINRFGQLHKAIRGISKQMLTKELRDLEKNGIIIRKVFPVVPPRVEYYISEKGKNIAPVIKALRKLGQIF